MGMIFWGADALQIQKVQKPFIKHRGLLAIKQYLWHTLPADNINQTKSWYWTNIACKQTLHVSIWNIIFWINPWSDYFLFHCHNRKGRRMFYKAENRALFGLFSKQSLGPQVEPNSPTDWIFTLLRSTYPSRGLSFSAQIRANPLIC